jgi:hypothetical protein
VVSVRTDSYQDWELQDQGSIAAEEDQAPRNTLVRGSEATGRDLVIFPRGNIRGRTEPWRSGSIVPGKAGAPVAELRWGRLKSESRVWHLTQTFTEISNGRSEFFGRGEYYRMYVCTEAEEIENLQQTQSTGRLLHLEERLQGLS